MGEVYLVYDSMMHREVALKVIKGDSDDDKVFEQNERMLIESRAMARFNHPNIIQIYDIRFEQGVLYIVMPVIKGVALKTLMEKKDYSNKVNIEFIDSNR